MRSIIGAILALAMLVGAASAAEVEGHIKKIDKDRMVITLDNGKAYKLPGEFDLDSIKEGMDVLIAYDKVGGENLITDMQWPQ